MAVNKISFIFVYTKQPKLGTGFLNITIMNYYGKNVNDLTKLEKRLLEVDQMIIGSMVMNLQGESLIGGMIKAGTPEDIEEKMFHRASIVSEILDIKNPEEETIFSIIDDTQYNIQDFGVIFSEKMYNKKVDVVYYYFTKQNELAQKAA